MKFGLSNEIVAQLKSTLSKFDGVEGAWVFGSRARETHRAGSDIDLAISAPKLSSTQFALLCADLEAIPMVFPLDIVRIETVENEVLLAEIKKQGRKI